MKTFLSRKIKIFYSVISPCRYFPIDMATYLVYDGSIVNGSSCGRKIIAIKKCLSRSTKEFLKILQLCLLLTFAAAIIAAAGEFNNAFRDYPRSRFNFYSGWKVQRIMKILVGDFLSFIPQFLIFSPDDDEIFIKSSLQQKDSRLYSRKIRK